MTPAGILADLLEAGLQLWREGDRLCYRSPKGILSTELRDRLAEHKPAVLALLRPGCRYAVPSPAQQRMWFLDRWMPDLPIYNSPEISCRLRGPLDSGALRQSLDVIVGRHEPLRTLFTAFDGRPVQIILDSAETDWKEEDLRGVGGDGPEAAARRRLEEEARRPFDLQSEQPMRARLFRIGDEDHLLALVFHHIAVDGGSLTVFLDELAVLYPALRRGAPASLPEVGTSYADIAALQRRPDPSRMEADLAYWRRKLERATTVLDWPADWPRPAAPTFRGGRTAFLFSPERSAALKDRARREGVTLYMVLLAGFQALLHRYCGQVDFTVGSPVAGRSREWERNLIGLFVNTVVLRADLSGDPTFRELLGRVRPSALQAFAHASLPFERLVDALQLERGMGQSPLFQAMLVLQHPIEPRRALGDAILELTPTDTGTAKFDLAVSVLDRPHGIAGVAEYSADLFNADTVDRMMRHWENLLAAAATDPERRVSELPLLDAEERRAIRVGFNQTDAPIPEERRIHRLFEAQAARTPEAPALIWRGGEMSYRELNGRANRLARRLRRLGVGIETLVAVCVERSPDAIVALLAVLKAGGAYVPLDPSYPRDRLEFLLNDTDAPVVLVSPRLTSILPKTAAAVVPLDASGENGDPDAADNLEGGAGPDNLAYVIHTSGSTGRPKGVLIEHRSVANLIASFIESYRPGPRDRILQQASLSFDASVAEIFPLLSSGGAVVLVDPREALDCEGLKRVVTEFDVTMFGAVPSVLARLNRQRDLPLGLRLILSGGEPLAACDVDRLCRIATVTNGYGPTETTVCAAFHRLDESTLTSNDDLRIPIGRPLINTRIYILDARMEPMPIGVPGEVYIGGAGVARGYLNRPDLTAEAFVPDPFGPPGARLYRTGDRARYRPDGTIEFLGRMDQQVKIRGVRVELAEIESCLRRHPDVREAAVAVLDGAGGDRTLAAYVVPASMPGPDPAALREHAAHYLPPAMVPAAFHILDELPRMPNGKLDLRALPAPRPPEPRRSGEVLEPRTEVEEALVDIWRSILGVERVGICDNFFERGGHSLLAAQVVARVRDLFDVEVGLRTFMEAPTVAALAAAVEDAVMAEVEGLAEDEAQRLVAGESRERHVGP